MNPDQHLDAATTTIVQRARDRFQRHRTRGLVATDRMFVKLFVGQWVCAIVGAVVLSPYSWQGKIKVLHYHVWIAVVLGGLIISLPIALAMLAPGKALTRHVIAVAQMLFSALFIHLSGGRIETHFHIFGSLAFLAFYLDWTVLLTATIATATDHFLRGILWPESIYGIVNPEWWRFLEHAAWVVFCVAFLGWSCRRQLKDWLGFAEEGGMLEALAESEWREKSVIERAAEEANAPKV